MKKARCVENKGGETDLEIGKIYRVISTVPKGWIRVVDDSGEDYLYLRRWFEEVKEE